MPILEHWSEAWLPTLLTAVIMAAMMRLLDPQKPGHRPIMALLPGLLLIQYLVWRVTSTWPSHLNWWWMWWPALFLVFEIVNGTNGLFSLVSLSRFTNRTPEADAHEARLRSLGDAVPSVDVLICTYNETREVLEKSILCARSIDYPASRLAIWVCDDTRRDWLRDWCAELGVGYIRRADNTHAKAGNINHAMSWTAARTNGELILILDADFAVRPNICYRMAGFFADPKIGVLQTPQHFFNADPIQHNLLGMPNLGDEQRFFFDIIQPAKDAWDSAFSCGTSGMVRRTAMDQIGGMPTESITEDIHLSYVLMARGWITRYLNERLSVGLAPEGVKDYLTQRARWAQGVLQVALLENGPWQRGLTLMQRLEFWTGFSYWLTRPFLLLVMLAPAMYWWFGIPVMAAGPTEIIWYVVPAIIASGMQGYWVSGRRLLPIFNEVSQLLVAPVLTRTIGSWIRQPFGAPFKVTAKGGDRDAAIVHWTVTGQALWIMLALALGMVIQHIDALAWIPNTGAHMANSIVTVINLILLGLVALIGVEIPRQRKEERLAVNWTAEVCAPDGTTRAIELRDLSVTGARLHDETAALQRGQSLVLRIPEVGLVPATVTAVRGHGAGVLFTLTPEIRNRLVVTVYTRLGEWPAPVTFLGMIRLIGRRIVHVPYQANTTQTRVMAPSPIEERLSVASAPR